MGVSLDLTTDLKENSSLKSWELLWAEEIVRWHARAKRWSVLVKARELFCKQASLLPTTCWSPWGPDVGLPVVHGVTPEPMHLLLWPQLMWLGTKRGSRLLSWRGQLCVLSRLWMQPSTGMLPLWLEASLSLDYIYQLSQAGLICDAEHTVWTDPGELSRWRCPNPVSTHA